MNNNHNHNKLQNIIQSYLSDTDEYQARLQLINQRTTSLPLFQNIIHNFITDQISLSEFGDQLSRALQPATIWYAQQPFLMEIRKFSKNHNDSNNYAASQLRSILTDLNAHTLGSHIEQFHQFLSKERIRLLREGKSSSTIVATGNSAHIVSLFAQWLDPDGDIALCREGIRTGILKFIQEGLIQPRNDLKLTSTSISITNAREYTAFKETVNSLLAIEPRLKYSPYWAEFFFYWLKNREEAQKSASLITKEEDDSTLFTRPRSHSRPLLLTEEKATYGQTSLPSMASPFQQSSFLNEDYIPHTPTSSLVSDPPILQVQDPDQLLDEPLKPTPEPLLTRLIHEVQRHILIDEKVIRRIYHALLAGHVILTGAPGTGKTELARLIPETLWQSSLATSSVDFESVEDVPLSKETAYTTRLVTATDDWSPRTLISGLVPYSQNGALSYKIQFGHLTSSILANWSSEGSESDNWSTLTLQRTRVTTTSSIERGTLQKFKGQWLVIDEFNRAPIDLALGDALTALGGNDVLRVALEAGSAELPIPQDFRIIGTLHSFDRNYLNQISEALKRRFSFIEILPPDRSQRIAEQGIVLYKALKKVSHLTTAISVEDDTLVWDNEVIISFETGGQYTILWNDEQSPFRLAFEAAWRVIEVIRIYRQLGTAQLINLFRYLLITGLVQNYSTTQSWLEQALDVALCDTIADQLQILLPDEIEALLLYFTGDTATFSATYNQHLQNQISNQQRLYGQLLALSSICRDDHTPYLPVSQVEEIAQSDQPSVPPALLTELFHLHTPIPLLIEFSRRLRTFKTERGL